MLMNNKPPTVVIEGIVVALIAVVVVGIRVGGIIHSAIVGSCSLVGRRNGVSHSNGGRCVGLTIGSFFNIRGVMILAIVLLGIRRHLLLKINNVNGVSLLVLKNFLDHGVGDATKQRII